MLLMVTFLLYFAVPQDNFMLSKQYFVFWGEGTQAVCMKNGNLSHEADMWANERELVCRARRQMRIALKMFLHFNFRNYDDRKSL